METEKEMRDWMRREMRKAMWWCFAVVLIVITSAIASAIHR